MKNWLSVYKISKQINLAQVLDALENLADKIGLDNGLKGWEKLAAKGS